MLEELQKELFSLFDTAERLPYKFYNIYTNAHVEVGDISAFRRVWRGETTPKGNPRTILNTEKNIKKLRAAINYYETQLQVARKETERALEMEVNL